MPAIPPPITSVSVRTEVSSGTDAVSNGTPSIAHSTIALAFSVSAFVFAPYSLKSAIKIFSGFFPAITIASVKKLFTVPVL